MSSYSHRQRVLLALNHQQPDRVPLDMMGNATMLLDKTYINLRDHLGLSAIPPTRSGTTANYYDERILEYFDIDFRRIFLGKKPTGKSAAREDGSYVDAWGVQYRKDGLYLNAVTHPLKDAKTVRDVEDYPWPKADEVFTADGLAEKASQMFENTDYALVARNPLSLGFLDRACQLMGMSEFMITMMTAAEVAGCLLEHLLCFYEQTYAIFLDAVGPHVQIIETADDLGTQQALLISPELYRKFIKPCEKRLYALIREKAPVAFIFRHCDGAIFEIIGDLIEVGVTILNPMQTSANGMDGRLLKQTFGDNICFHGGIERMEAGVDELVSEVKTRIDTLSAQGGYIFASCNHMIDVKPENIIAMFETARDYGKY